MIDDDETFRDIGKYAAKNMSKMFELSFGRFPVAFPPDAYPILGRVVALSALAAGWTLTKGDVEMRRIEQDPETLR